MIRSLVWQLLLALAKRGILSLEFIDNRSRRDAIEQRDLSILCYVFRMLLGLFYLDTPVYCIVDGIDWYEEPRFVAEMEFALSHLQSAVNDQQLQASFKLLMTSSYQSRYFVRKLQLSGSQYVDLQPDPFHDGTASERDLADETRQLRMERNPLSRDSDWWNGSDDHDAPENYA
jgi:hypothetical protein